MLPGASTQPLDAGVFALADAESGIPAVPVEPGGQAEDPGLDGLLPGSAADAIAAFGLTGQAGESQVLASASGRPVRVLLLGVGDRSAEALRRAGAELGGRDGATVATTVVAGEAAGGERVWRMPLEDDYLPALASDVADLSHISRAETTMPGSIIAALFLRLLTQP